MTGDRDITDICLKLLALESAQQLLEFELDNQKWFEEFIPPRESEFYSLDGVIDHIQHFFCWNTNATNYCHCSFATRTAIL
ncbi:hypothetical protein QW180_28560 [Vibrio sinaloensis]|nr:hypothetical protein [Vibrio sinaloensis]